HQEGRCLPPCDRERRRVWAALRARPGCRAERCVRRKAHRGVRRTGVWLSGWRRRRAGGASFGRGRVTRPRRIGVALWGGMPIAEAVDCVVEADNLGYESAFVVENYGSQFAFLAACAARTKNIRLGTGVATVYRQSPTLLAASIA